MDVQSRIDNTIEQSFNIDENIYLNLCEKPIRFEPVSKSINVFYDDANQQVFAVRSGGTSGVVVKGPAEKLNCNFRMEDKGPVLSIKFSPDQRILAVQRSNHSVEFLNFTGPTENIAEYSQTSKNKNANILGFVWVSSLEILFVTKLGLELFQIYPEKRMLKYLRNVSVNIEWFLHSPDNNILVVSSPGGIIQPFQLKPGNIYKFPKLDVDPATLPRNSSGRIGISERDVSIISLYGQAAVLLMRPKQTPISRAGYEVDVFILSKDVSPAKSRVLMLETAGRFAINVIDNVIVVHHQASKTSMLFDIRLSGRKDGAITYHRPVVVAMPIKSFKLKTPLVSTAGQTVGTELHCELYSSHWVVFQPNVIIDAKLGCLWFLELMLEPVEKLIHDKIRLVEFLLQRKNGKPMLMKLLQKQVLTPEADISLISGVLDKINDNYRSYLNVELQNQMALPTSGKQEAVTTKGNILIDQQDLYTNIFTNFPNCNNITDQYIIFALTEYIRSLTRYQIPVQHYIYELLINAMVRQKAFYQLHQFLQYNVVTDSKPLACLLLSLEGVYPAAHQLALDMLKRLPTSNDLIVEILLNKQKIIPALRFIQASGRADYVSSRKFLDAALRTGDSLVFYSVFRFFEERNLRINGSPVFPPNDLCGSYVQHFIKTFGRSSSLPGNEKEGA